MRNLFIVASFAGLGCFAGWCDSAFSADLKAPFTIETAKVLPKGVRNPRFFNLLMSVDSRFNDSGGRVPLGERLNKQVAWDDVLEAQRTEVERSMLRSIIQDSVAGTNGPGSTTGQVKTFANVKIPALALGVSERLTLAVALPILSIEVSADTGFVASEAGRQFVTTVSSASSPEKGHEAARKLNDAVNQKLERLGYYVIQNETFSGIGDVQLISKYQLGSDEMNLLTWKTTLSLPTGRSANVDRALDIPLGDGRFALGASLIYDRRLPLDFRLNVVGGVSALMPNEMERRLPRSADDSLSSDRELLTRKLGGQFILGTALEKQFGNSGVLLGAGYHYQFLTRTSYGNSGLFPAERYRWLEDLQPLQSLHSLILSGGFSSVEMYRRKKFFYPFEAKVAVSHPVSGRNVTTNDVISGELVLFF